MTTPAQEAKEFAAANGFVIRSDCRRYRVLDSNNTLIAEVGGYPAALNAMKRHVEQVQEFADAIKLGEVIGKNQLQQCSNFNYVAIVDNAPDPACKIAPAGWDKVETSVEDWNAGKVNHPFAPAAAPRTGWYVRVTDPRGFVIDIPCPNMKEAYRSCAQTANWFKRNGLTPNAQRSVIFKRG